MTVESLLPTIQQLSASELDELLQRRQAEDKALRALFRAVLAREREERRQGQEKMAKGGADAR